jgi:hypothetical protein
MEELKKLSKKTKEAAKAKKDTKKNTGTITKGKKTKKTVPVSDNKKDLTEKPEGKVEKSGLITRFNSVYEFTQKSSIQLVLLAIEYRSYILFPIAITGIYLYGDYASV